MEKDDAMVVVGSRKNIPSIFVEEVDEKKSTLRNRVSPLKLYTSTPAPGAPRYVPTALYPDSPQSDKLDNVEVSFNDSGYHGHQDSLDWDRGRVGSLSKKLRNWKALPSTLKLLRDGWKGRASFMEEEQSVPWIRKLGPQQVLRSLILAVILASFGFAVLTYTRHMRGPAKMNINNKSIEFSVVKRSVQVEEKNAIVDKMEGEENIVKRLKDETDVNMKAIDDKTSIIYEENLDLVEEEDFLVTDVVDDNFNLELEKETKRDANHNGFRFASDNDDSELVNVKKRDNDKEFRYVSDSEDSELLNVKKRDNNDNGFRYVSDNDDSDIVNVKKRDNNDNGFRFASDNEDSELVNVKKRDNNDNEFRYASDSEDSELVNVKKRDNNENGFRFVSDNKDSELVNVKKRDNNENGFRFTSDNEDSELVNVKKRDNNDKEFRFVSDSEDSYLVNVKKRDNDKEFRFASDGEDSDIVNVKKRDNNDNGFRYASDNDESQLVNEKR